MTDLDLSTIFADAENAGKAEYRRARDTYWGGAAYITNLKRKRRSLREELIRAHQKGADTQEIMLNLARCEGRLVGAGMPVKRTESDYGKDRSMEYKWVLYWSELRQVEVMNGRRRSESGHLKVRPLDPHGRVLDHTIEVAIRDVYDTRLEAAKALLGRHKAREAALEIDLQAVRDNIDDMTSLIAVLEAEAVAP